MNVMREDNKGQI